MPSASPVPACRAKPLPRSTSCSSGLRGRPGPGPSAPRPEGVAHWLIIAVMADLRQSRSAHAGFFSEYAEGFPTWSMSDHAGSLGNLRAAAVTGGQGQSFRSYAGLLDDRAPAGGFFAHERIECGGGAAGEVRPLLGQEFSDAGHVQELRQPVA